MESTTEIGEAPAENVGPIHRSIEAMNRQRRQFSAMKTAHLSTYLERQRTKATSPRLVVLNGWSDRCQPSSVDQIPPQLLHHLLKENNESLVRCGGYWVHLGGVGIVINPGRWFLERFHAAGLHIWDIDHVIVTDGRSTAYSDLERIWTFNKEINTLLKEWQLEPHVISYWLHATAFEQNAHIVRPLFRQEMATVHRLGTFHDISAFETVELHDHLSFDYSSTQPTTYAPSPLMVRFRTTQDEEPSPAQAQVFPPTEQQPNSSTVGFLSQAPWAEAQNAFLSCCQTLILGVGETSFEEITSQSRPASSLGTAGIINILDNPTTRLAIIAEQGLSEGDIRIESLKYLREELKGPSTTILPAEEGMTIDLQTLHMTARGLDTPTPVQSIRAVRSAGQFSQLTFFDELSIL
jgi:hypothetical protein